MTLDTSVCRPPETRGGFASIGQTDTNVCTLPSSNQYFTERVSSEF